MFICSTTSNLNNFKPQQLQPQKRVQNEKKKQTRPQPRNHTKDPHFFSELCDFLKLFGLKFFPKGSPLQFFLMFCNTMDVKKSQRVPPFTFFGTVTLFKNLIKKIFRKFFHVSKGSPLQFLKFSATSWSFTKPEGSPF